MPDGNTSTQAPGERFGHRPVLLETVIAHLQPQPGDVVVDATFGGGGYTAAMSRLVGSEGRVIAIDRDPEAIGRGERRLESCRNVTLVHDNFSRISEIVQQQGISHVNVAVFDLGVSSFQVDDGQRGFSFTHNGPLDMRMNPADTLSAEQIINDWPVGDLEMLIWTYGQERFARRIARAIERDRPLVSTAALALVVSAAIPRKYWPKRIHPATRTFQAVRMEVNDELGSLQRGLRGAMEVLSPGGRLGVVSFHSLEDKIAKNLLNVSPNVCTCPPQTVVCTCARQAPLFRVSHKLIHPSAEEVAENPRARSAKLRVATRVTGQ